MRKLLALFGYYKIDYGFACGRHWVEINGITFAQVCQDSEKDKNMNDFDVHRLGYYVIDRGRHWNNPAEFVISNQTLNQKRKEEKCLIVQSKA